MDALAAEIDANQKPTSIDDNYSLKKFTATEIRVMTKATDYLTCGLCSARVSGKIDQLFSHSKLCAMKKLNSLLCANCPTMVYQTRADFLRHSKDKHDADNNISYCIFCGTKMSTWLILHQHQAACFPALDPRSFEKCQFCDTSFFFKDRNNVYYFAHMNNEHMLELKQMWSEKCSFCPFLFPNVKTRIDHEKVCAERRSFRNLSKLQAKLAKRTPTLVREEFEIEDEMEEEEEEIKLDTPHDLDPYHETNHDVTIDAIPEEDVTIEAIPEDATFVFEVDDADQDTNAQDDQNHEHEERDTVEEEVNEQNDLQNGIESDVTSDVEFSEELITGDL